MSTLYLTHSACLQHDTGYGHPERSDRLRAIQKALNTELFAGLKREDAPLADAGIIALAHPKAYIEALQRAAPKQGQGLAIVDGGDTVISPGSWEAALRAAGAAIRAVDQVMTGAASNAFCAVRPPGHHAEAAQPMGFCLFNNAVIAGLRARAAHGAERIAVADFDVHHGNGTQAMFWSDKDLFYASSHQMPLFPGTGYVSETGAAKNIVNAPLRSGDGGSQFREAWEMRILPALHNFAPDILIISAGFDAHQDDPLANIGLLEEDFAWVTEKLAGAARRHAGGRIVSTLEGGYDLEALAKSAAVHVRVLMDMGS